jgi:hypothetical protein
MLAMLAVKRLGLAVGDEKLRLTRHQQH